MGRFACLIVVLALGACSPQPDPSGPVTPDNDEVGHCGAACERWIDLGCVDAEVCARYDEPNPECVEWVSCEDWCVDLVLNAPPGVVFHPECVATAQPADGTGDICDWLDLECSTQ